MADNKKPKWVKGVTPKGVASWPHLNTPDEYKGKKSYKVNLTLEGDLCGDLIEKIEEETQKALADTKAKLEDVVKNGKTGDAKAKAKKALAALSVTYPHVAAVDDDGNETGDYVFKFKANAEIKDKKTENMKPVKIPLFDAKGNKMTSSIWGGSIIRVSYSMIPYYVASANTCGVSLRIEGVKVIELVSGSGGRSADSLGFGEEEEGYEADLMTEDESSPDDSGSSASDDDTTDF